MDPIRTRSCSRERAARVNISCPVDVEAPPRLERVNARFVNANVLDGAHKACTYLAVQEVPTKSFGEGAGALHEADSNKCLLASSRAESLEKQIQFLRACFQALHVSSQREWAQHDVQRAERAALQAIEQRSMPDVTSMLDEALNGRDAPALERVITCDGRQVSAIDKAFLEGEMDASLLSEGISVVTLRQRIEEVLHELRSAGVSRLSEYLETKQERGGYHYFVIWKTLLQNQSVSAKM